jgi:SnoaL-like domain
MRIVPGWHKLAAMSRGALGVVEEWLDAVNRCDGQRVIELSADDVEIVGPRGSAHGRRVLAEWLARAGFSAEVLRWFCGSGGRVVVEQEARWAEMHSGMAQGRARIGSQFMVSNGAINYYQRQESLDHALRAAGLDFSTEVTSRSR